MFSDESHCIYRANPLAEVICQLRFPEILKINTSLPADFQEQIRESFPRYSVRQEAPAPRISGAPGSMTLENQPTTPNYQFLSEDGVWRVNLTDQFISLACTRYLRWEDFAAKLDRPLAAFISLYRPAYFERVGLRYLNFISRQALNLEGVPYARLIAPCYLGILSQDDVPEAAATRSSVDAELAIADGCRVKLHAGPGLVKRGGRPDSEVQFVFDQDLFLPGKTPVNRAASVLETLHRQAFPIFRGAVRQPLHDAMQPEYRA